MKQKASKRAPKRSKRSKYPLASKVRAFQSMPLGLRLGLFLILSVAIVGTYWHYASRPTWLHASLRDSCGASELYIGVRGSGETKDDEAGLGSVAGSTFHRFSSHMSPTQVAATPAQYLAITVNDFRVIGMYDESYAHGVQALKNELYYWNHTCPNYHFVLAGYSQGADATASVLWDLNSGNSTDVSILNKIDGVALFGDPGYSPADKAVDMITSSTKQGILAIGLSNHHIRPSFPANLASKVHSWCRSGDPVCQIPATCQLFAATHPNDLKTALWKSAGAIDCGVSIRFAVNEHGRYITGGQTEAAGAWLADKVRAAKINTSIATQSHINPVSTPTPAPQPTATNKTTSPAPTSKPKTTQPTTTQTTTNSSPTPAPTPTPSPIPVNRQAITSYDRMQSGAPYHGYFTTAWQNFTAASNTITSLSATVGSPGATAGTTVSTTLTLRLCTTSSCGTVLAETHPQITNYGATTADIGDIAVTPGATYYIAWYQPAAIAGQTWVTYWWAGGSTIATSDQMQATVRGYNR